MPSVHADLEKVSTEVPVFALHRRKHVAVRVTVLACRVGLTNEPLGPEGVQFGHHSNGASDGYVEKHSAAAVNRA